MSPKTGQKAFLETESGGRIPCLFNPAELKLHRANSWRSDSVPGKEAPELYFTGGDSGTLSLDLVFDTTAEGKAVTKYTNQLVNLMKIDPKLPGHDDGSNNGRPPWVKFHWGDLHSFKAVVSTLDLSFTYFGRSGMPLRARASVVLTQFEADEKWGPQNPTSGTPRPQRAHQVRNGETLDRIAATHYGDPTRWRDIAAANGVTDPLALVPGSYLAIPKPRG